MTTSGWRPTKGERWAVYVLTLLCGLSAGIGWFGDGLDWRLQVAGIGFGAVVFLVASGLFLGWLLVQLPYFGHVGIGALLFVCLAVWSVPFGYPGALAVWLALIVPAFVWARHIRRRRTGPDEA
jgi:hypothetical protein